jgi:lipopolysaccharide/colanic/teichoic acid biosynthesis glycosyltransferase
MLGTAITLLFLNPLVNPGPVFFRQKRMGMNGKPFSIWKFRTMIPCNKCRRSDGEVEKDRITPLGRILRHHRLDELPNFINVLRGEMSLIGPRPEMWDHAIEFIDIVPRYRERFCVLPGVTGLAQVRYGYADNSFSLRVKAKYDSIYVRKFGFKMDIYVLIRTVQVVLSGHGAK